MKFYIKEFFQRLCSSIKLQNCNKLFILFVWNKANATNSRISVTVRFVFVRFRATGIRNSIFYNFVIISNILNWNFFFTISNSNFNRINILVSWVIYIDTCINNFVKCHSCYFKSTGNKFFLNHSQSDFSSCICKDCYILSNR